jgi:type III secretion system FlhB-like substrate exporter
MNEKNISRVYEQFDNQDDFKSYSESVIKEANRANIPVEQNPDFMKHMVKNDLRDAMPSQLFELIGRITTAVEKVESEEDK